MPIDGWIWPVDGTGWDFEGLSEEDKADTQAAEPTWPEGPRL